MTESHQARARQARTVIPPGAHPPAPVPDGEELVARKATNLTRGEGVAFTRLSLSLGYVCEAHLLRQIILDRLEQERPARRGARRKKRDRSGQGVDSPQSPD